MLRFLMSCLFLLILLVTVEKCPCCLVFSDSVLIVTVSHHVQFSFNVTASVLVNCRHKRYASCKFLNGIGKHDRCTKRLLTFYFKIKTRFNVFLVLQRF